MLQNNQFSVFHSTAYPWQYVDSDQVLHLMICVKGAGPISIKCLACDPCDTDKGVFGEDMPRLFTYEMRCEMEGPGIQYFTLHIPMNTHKLRYHFSISVLGHTYLYDESGLSEDKEELYIRPFFVAYTYSDRCGGVPKWCNGMVWYQIFPDRFAKEDSDQTHGWQSGKITDKDLVCGGTLKGITSKIPYLKQLGTKGIYLNPIFQASSIHRYDIIDYLKIDPILGTEEDFVELCEKCHSNGIRIMMDGVFNHCSYLSPQFQDVINKGEHSRYYDWFIVYDTDRLKKMDVKTGADAQFRVSPVYETFAFVPSMPKFNTCNPQVMDYLIGAAEYWTKKCGIDAWRLDVPDEVNIEFLRAFRRRIKTRNPDIYIVGEFWGNAARWLDGETFDGAMNYPLYFIVRDFLAKEKISAFPCAKLLTQCLMANPPVRRCGMFTFCSTHDTPRILWHCGEDRKKRDLCYILTAALGGQLSVYYGDEIGMTGGYDPDNRRCYPWNSGTAPKEMKEAIRDAVSLASDDGKGRICRICALDEEVLGVIYERRRLYINRSKEEKELPDGTKICPQSYCYL